MLRARQAGTAGEWDTNLGGPASTRAHLGGAACAATQPSGSPSPHAPCGGHERPQARLPLSSQALHLNLQIQQMQMREQLILVAETGGLTRAPSY